jgi:hypothetical protein
MTVKELILETYDKCGQPTDLSPYVYVNEVPTFSFVSAGAVALLDLVNRAYRQLASWKLPNGHLVRFREHNQTMMFQTKDWWTTPVTSQSGNTLYFGTTFQDNMFAGWFISINGQAQQIVGNTVSSITTIQPFTVATVGYSGQIYKRWFPVLATAQEVSISGLLNGQYIKPTNGRKIISFRRVNCLSINNQEVYPADRTQMFWDLPALRGYPMQYRFTNLGLEFEWAPPDGTVYRLESYSEPEQLTDETQVPDIPAAWHELIWMIAAWIRIVKDKNFEEADSDFRRITNIIVSRVQQNEHEYDLTNVGVYTLM